MNAEMLGEITGTCERLATILAVKGLLSCVSPSMFCESTGTSKTFPAIIAFVRLLGCVNSQVFSKAA